MPDIEELLTGGNVAKRVVRIGSTVRKPASYASASVQSLLAHLQERGFDASPTHFGLDDQRRQILEYIPGTPRSAHSMSHLDLTRIGTVIRKLHDLSATFRHNEADTWDVAIAPDREDLVCHNDLAPWNLIQNEDRWVFIDWDGAGPSSRMWDLAYAAINFLPVEPNGDPQTYKSRLSAILEGYGLALHERAAMPEMMARRARSMFDLLVESYRTGKQPWARLYEENHGAYWKSAARYLDTHASELKSE